MNDPCMCTPNTNQGCIPETKYIKADIYMALKNTKNNFINTHLFISNTF